MIEAGVPGYSALTWNGLLAPAGTPPDVVARLNAAIVKAMRSPAMKEQLAKIGQDPAWSTPDEFAAFLREETVEMVEGDQRGQRNQTPMSNSA